jgi:hypothetical protein
LHTNSFSVVNVPEFTTTLYRQYGASTLAFVAIVVDPILNTALLDVLVIAVPLVKLIQFVLSKENWKFIVALKVVEVQTA